MPIIFPAVDTGAVILHSTLTMGFFRRLPAVCPFQTAAGADGNSCRARARRQVSSSWDLFLDCVCHPAASATCGRARGCCKWEVSKSLACRWTSHLCCGLHRATSGHHYHAAFSRDVGIDVRQQHRLGRLFVHHSGLCTRSPTWGGVRYMMPDACQLKSLLASDVTTFAVIHCSVSVGRVPLRCP